MAILRYALDLTKRLLRFAASIIYKLRYPILLLLAFTVYVLYQAAKPAPQGLDGKPVDPVSPVAPVTPPHEGEDRPTPPIPPIHRRKPVVSVESLERMDDDDITAQNWDAALTLANLSSKVYDEDREEYARETLHFDVAKAVDFGERHSMVCSNSKILVVAFRGTLVWTDGLLDLAGVPFLAGSVLDGCLVHSGFRTACDLLYSKVLREIENQGGRDKQIIVTGHSLGAAIAVLFAYRAESTDDLQIKSIVTFGQPLVGNGRFASLLVRQFMGRHIRFVHRDDLVTRIARPYFHSGARVLLVEQQAPVFWTPQVLAQAAPGQKPEENTDYLIDPEVAALAEDEMNHLKAFLEVNPPDNEAGNDSHRARHRRRKRGKRSLAVGAVGAPLGTGFKEWIGDSIDDHYMIHYIQCIEAQEVDDVP